MRLRSALVALVVVLATLGIHPATSAQESDCDPSDLFDQAAALKASGDTAKDRDALVELSKAISVYASNCPSPVDPLPLNSGKASRSEPVPLGSLFALALHDTNNFNIGITQVVRGEKAMRVLEDTNSFNDPPADGSEYLLAYVVIDYISGSEDEPLKFNRYDFKSVSNKKILEIPSLVLPDPNFDVQAFPGSRSEGWIGIEVYKDDPAPLLVFGMKYDGTGGFYFATN